MNALVTPINWVAIVCALGAFAIVGWYLVRRPPLVAVTKLWLLIGIAVLPIFSALTTNVVGLQTSTQVGFCGSCHVMTPYTDDLADPESTTLAAVHSRNKWFGSQACYTCHSNYGMFGTVLTKISGLGHVVAYNLNYRNTPLEDTIGNLELYSPFLNQACQQCHSMTSPNFKNEREHKSADDDLKEGKISCVSSGCHGPAHPFTKSSTVTKTSTVGSEQ